MRSLATASGIADSRSGFWFFGADRESRIPETFCSKDGLKQRNGATLFFWKNTASLHGTGRRYLPFSGEKAACFSQTRSRRSVDIKKTRRCSPITLLRSATYPLTTKGGAFFIFRRKKALGRIPNLAITDSFDVRVCRCDGFEGYRTESKKLLHFVQWFGRKPGRIAETAAFCTLLFDEDGNIWNIHADKMYKVQLFVGISVLLLEQLHLVHQLYVF